VVQRKFKLKYSRIQSLLKPP